MSSWMADDDSESLGPDALETQPFAEGTLDWNSNQTMSIINLPHHRSRGGCIAEFFIGLLISALYVGSLYILPSFWRQRSAGRDHPAWLRERFFAAGGVCLLAIATTYCLVCMRKCHFQPTDVLADQFSDAGSLPKAENAENSSPSSAVFLPLRTSQFLQLIGIRWDGLLVALFVPAILTWVLFTGPIVQELFEAYILNKGEMYAYETIKIAILQLPHYFSNYLWWRNYIVAPLSEEIVYRACILVILERCLSVGQLMVITPLFFGVAHVHHLAERIRIGMPLEHCIAVTAIQVCYTCIFGAYEVFIFLRTRHLLACVVVHTVCNIMGFPNLPSKHVFFSYRRCLWITYACYVIGLLAFLVLLMPATSPDLYKNIFQKLYDADGGVLCWNKSRAV